jgi:lipid-A-disaccharide synthase
VALPNILAGEEVMAEFLQENCQAGPIAANLTQLLDDPAYRARQQEKFAHIAAMLGRDGEAPSLRAADAVLRIIRPE